MNIAFIELSHKLGDGTTYVSHSNYSISSADMKTKQQLICKKKSQSNADERRIITSTHPRECKGKQHLFALL